MQLSPSVYSVLTHKNYRCIVKETNGEFRCYFKNCIERKEVLEQSNSQEPECQHIICVNETKPNHPISTWTASEIRAKLADNSLGETAEKNLLEHLEIFQPEDIVCK